MNNYDKLTAKALRLAGVILCASVLGGCASIVSKSNYPVAINSNPSGVDFYVTNFGGTRVHSGTTPATVTLSTKRGYFKSQAYTIHLEPVGAPKKEYAIRTSTDGWYFGNLLLGGIIGMLIVDPLTGAMFKYPPEIMVELDGAANAGAGDHTMTIASIDTLSAEQRAQLVPIAQ